MQETLLHPGGLFASVVFSVKWQLVCMTAPQHLESDLPGHSVGDRNWSPAHSMTTYTLPHYLVCSWETLST